MTFPELNADMRGLIDAQLDEIERALLRAEVPYSDRRHILGEVETQIFELLARRSENPSRDDLEAVLSSLDPAEAYVPEELRGASGRPIVEKLHPRYTGPRVSILALGSGVLTAVILVIGGLSIVFQDPRDKVGAAVLTAICLLITTAAGSFALLQIRRSKGNLRGEAFALLAVIGLPLGAIDVLVGALVMSAGALIPYLLTATALVYLNFTGLRRLWHWYEPRRNQLGQSLRSAVNRAAEATARQL